MTVTLICRKWTSTAVSKTMLLLSLAPGASLQSGALAKIFRAVQQDGERKSVFRSFCSHIWLQSAVATQIQTKIVLASLVFSSHTVALQAGLSVSSSLTLVHQSKCTTLTVPSGTSAQRSFEIVNLSGPAKITELVPIY